MGNISIAKIWGVPIRLHLSWFMIVGLITWSLASGYFPRTYPSLDQTAYWILGLITALAFAASVLLHELGHVLLAQRNGIRVRGVTLFIFGGVAELTEEPRTPGAEFRIAIAGPVVSLLLAALFGGLWLLDRAVPMLAAPSEYLFRINLMLGLFNLIPGFPLDGGRVLRAAVWQVTGSLNRATRLASSAGQLVAFGFIAIGLFTLLRGDIFNGIWLAFIGWFLQNAAVAALSQVKLQQALSGARVGQVMRQDFDSAPALMAIDELVNQMVLNGGRRSFLVHEHNQPVGFVTLDDITAVPRRKWPYTTLRQVMQPFDRAATVTPETELFTALQTMETAHSGQIPVTGGDPITGGKEVVGLISREDVARYLRTRAELGM